MPRFAVLVEDDEEQLPRIAGVLSSAGFAVVAFRDADSAGDLPAGIGQPVDLVVVDRRVPQSTGTEPEDAVGDALLMHLLDAFPDTPFIVFSAYTGIPHYQFAAVGKGVVTVGAQEQLDRVVLFEKTQTIEFRTYVQEIAEIVRRLENIDLNGVDVDDAHELDRRLMRRVAAHYGGASINVKELGGGLTSDDVWSCSVWSESGELRARVVVKRLSKKTAPSIGGLAEMWPASSVAAHVTTISGLCGGQRAKVMQFADEDGVPLLEWLAAMPNKAADQLAQLRQAIDRYVEGAHARSIRLDELVAPLVDWATLETRLALYAIAIPRPDLLVSTRTAAQHGDLHPGNVLIVRDRPILIDLESQVSGSILLDPITMLLSSLFHAESPLRTMPWPTPEQCSAIREAIFLEGCPASEWIHGCMDWTGRRTTGDREFWGLVLAFAVRQLGYKDVLEDDAVRERALALAGTASSALVAA